MHSIGQNLAMSTAADSVMPQSQLRLLYLSLERHAHELEEQVNKLSSGRALHTFSTIFSGMQESVLASFLLLELFGQEIRRGAYRSGQNSKHIHVASLCLSHRCQKI